MKRSKTSTESEESLNFEHFIPMLARELELSPNQIQSTLELLLSDNTIPFIARYRKEATMGLDEVQIGAIQDRFYYLSELEERKQVILQSILDQEKLTPELEKSINEAKSKQQLEDFYLPYKPKRRTKATIAKEQGLEPLAELMLLPESGIKTLTDWIAEQNRDREEVFEEEKTLQGARDILAERVSEDAKLRHQLRELTSRLGGMASSVRPDHDGKSSKFEMYYNFEEKLQRIPPHRVLGMRRGEKENVLSIRVNVPEEAVESLLSKLWISDRSLELREQWQLIVGDAYKRLLAPSIETDVRVDLKMQADASSIEMFSRNLRQLLLQPPGGARTVLGLDPAFKTGTKWVLVNNIGRFLKHGVIYPAAPQNKSEEAKEVLNEILQEHKVDIIAIGNGTASREVHKFIRGWIKDESHVLEALVVNESGASVYSASKVARDEFPDLDLTVRGAVSIARRYQDSLAELVKIEPKSIGVGQYQHDVNQTRLKQSLKRTVESCVNFVGVDLNRTSVQLLEHVSGISHTLARKIIDHRNLNGSFHNRQHLLEVKGMGAKTFEQSAGFLRVPESEHPLDRSAVHPENYTLVEKIAADLGVSLQELMGNETQLNKIDLSRYEQEGVGEYTLKDILKELRKPGRDPREDHQSVQFDESVNDISDLSKGMRLPGVITNVTHFGVFIDVGVHQDGLAHISQLSRRFIKDPMEVCSVGQQVEAFVLEVDEKRKRISLSLKIPEEREAKKPSATRPSRDGAKKSDPPEKNHRKGKKRKLEGKQKQPPKRSTGNFEEDMVLLMEKFNQR